VPRREAVARVDDVPFRREGLDGDQDLPRRHYSASKYRNAFWATTPAPTRQ
jgi:hypothetical protein